MLLEKTGAGTCFCGAWKERTRLAEEESRRVSATARFDPRSLAYPRNRSTLPGRGAAMLHPLCGLAAGGWVALRLNPALEEGGYGVMFDRGLPNPAESWLPMAWSSRISWG